MTEDKKTSPTQAILGLVILAAGVWYFFGGGMEKQADKDLRAIEKTVASEAVAEYQIAKRNGSAMDACAQAGLVSASYLQAKDEENYKVWKITEKSDCKAAGVSD
ncbi:hypothetical protein ACFQAT_10310 [Undibacterium arcticum]|uniref:Uncharacterized protein n=1 Tax=Undibacterium arcticum TaxID=1762892 RepID=A0ABV7EZJ9_9BURK